MDTPQVLSTHTFLGGPVIQGGPGPPKKEGNKRRKKKIRKKKEKKEKETVLNLLIIVVESGWFLEGSHRAPEELTWAPLGPCSIILKRCFNMGALFK